MFWAGKLGITAEKALNPRPSGSFDLDQESPKGSSHESYKTLPCSKGEIDGVTAIQT